jgi:hypothetical protein
MNLKIDRKAFSVASLSEPSDEKAYWLEHPLNASNRSKCFEGSIMDIELPFDFKEFLKLLNEKASGTCSLGVCSWVSWLSARYK